MVKTRRSKPGLRRRAVGGAGLCSSWDRASRFAPLLVALVGGCAGEARPEGNGSSPIDSASAAQSVSAGGTAGSAAISATLGSVSATASPPSASALVPPSQTASASAAPLGVPTEGRLLTRLQYDASVRDLFNGLVHGPFSAGFPVENEVLGFGTNAHSHQASNWLVEGHLLASEAVSGQVITALPELLPCAATLPDLACGHAFIDEYAERAFRHATSDAERAPLYALFDEVFAAQGFETAIAMSVQSLLQSPQFLYRLEVAKELAAPEVYRISDWEMASRLSYLFWNSIPDDELRERARSNQLHEAADIEHQARRLAGDPRTQDTLRDFTSQWLGLHKLDSIARKNAAGVSTELNASWKASLSEFAVQALWGPQGGIQSLLLSPRVFLNAELAQIYGAAVPSDAPSQGLFATDLPGQRVGLLTQPGLMALLAHAEQSAPIQRGVFIREHLLCQPPSAPPVAANTIPPDPDPTLTTRERFAAHTQQTECAGCHRMFDGMGLALEGFDQIGAYRDQENGLALNLAGEIYGTFDTSISGVFVGPDELAKRLAGSYQVRDCLVTEWYRYSMGRFDENVDLEGIKSVAQTAEAAGGGFAEIMVRLSLTDAFRFRAETPVDEDLY